MRASLALALAAALWSASSSRAAADGPLFERGFWLLPGASVAASNTSVAESSPAFGGELSLACLGCVDDIWVIGAYGDVVHDLEAGQTRLTLGPEFGGLLMVDAGLLLALGERPTSVGIALRLLVTLGAVAIYGRYGQALSGPELHYSELGLLLKLPLFLGPYGE